MVAAGDSGMQAVIDGGGTSCLRLSWGDDGDVAAERGGSGAATGGWGASWDVVDGSTGASSHTRVAFRCSDSGGTEGAGVVEHDVAVGRGGSGCGTGVCGA
jgi:hypothetical protein